MPVLGVATMPIDLIEDDLKRGGVYVWLALNIIMKIILLWRGAETVWEKLNPGVLREILNCLLRIKNSLFARV